MILFSAQNDRLEGKGCFVYAQSDPVFCLKWSSFAQKWFMPKVIRIFLLYISDSPSLNEPHFPDCLPSCFLTIMISTIGPILWSAEYLRSPAVILASLILTSSLELQGHRISLHPIMNNLSISLVLWSKRDMSVHWVQGQLLILQVKAA